MSARDELAKFIDHQINELYSPGDDVMGEDLATLILDAGYRKPRTITSAEELDALPNGAVVLSDVYKHHHGMAISFQRWEDGLWHRGARSGDTHPDNFLPATVLHEPEAAK